MKTTFEIERSLSLGGGYSLIHSSLANTVTYTDANLQPKTTYYYRIRAVNETGSSSFATEASAATLNGYNADIVTSSLRLYGFEYGYDARNRLIKKRIPGGDWVYTVYDNRDRIVMTQDGNQRTKTQWSFTKYDALNVTRQRIRKLIVTKFLTAPGSLTNLITMVTII